MKRLVPLLVSMLVVAVGLVAGPLAGTEKPAQSKPSQETRQVPPAGPAASSTNGAAAADPFGGKRPPTVRASGKSSGKQVKRKTAADASPFDPSPATAPADPFGGPGNPFDEAPGRRGAGDDPFGGDPFGSGRPAAKKKRAASVAPAAAPPARESAAPVKAVERRTLALESPCETVRRIEQELGRETAFEYLDTPLRDVVETIAARHNIPMIINTRALDDFGIGTDLPVTIMLRGVSLRSALRLMLREVDLTYVITDDVLEITTTEAAEGRLRSRIYRVASLLPAGADGAKLVELVMTHVEPDSWDQVGGPGSISFVESLNVVVVTHTENVHAQVDKFLLAIDMAASLQDSP